MENPYEPPQQQSISTVQLLSYNKTPLVTFAIGVLAGTKWYSDYTEISPSPLTNSLSNLMLCYGVGGFAGYFAGVCLVAFANTLKLLGVWR